MGSKWVIAAISPLGTAWLLGLLAWGLGVMGRRRSALALGGLALGWLLLWSLPGPSMWLRSQVEGPRSGVAATALEVPTAPVIVVLGGAINPPERAGEAPDLRAAVDRVWWAAQLFHAGRAPRLLLSGGHDPAVSSESEAASMRRLLLDLGVPPAAMVLEERSQTTRGNARESAAWLAGQGIQRIILVTSALHMDRAVALFRAQGLDVVPSPTDREVRAVPSFRYWLPDTESLDGSARAIKEVVGRWAGV